MAAPSPLVLALLLGACAGADKANTLYVYDTGPEGGGELDLDGDGYPASEDCNDQASSIHPGAVEACDEVDNDCDGLVDEDDPDFVGLDSWYYDLDGDGFGDPDNFLQGCSHPAGTLEDNTDCDDGDALVSPVGTESCNGIDDDCDALVDAEDPSVTDSIDLHPDADLDGYGDPDAATEPFCEIPTEGWTLDTADCDDTAADIHPDAAEACGDGVDSDCDGIEGPLDLGTGMDLDCPWAQLTGGSDQGAGVALAGPVDLNGDGVLDLVIGSHGEEAWLIEADSEGEISLPARGLAMTDLSGGRGWGTVVAAGDLDGDGVGDMLFGVPADDLSEQDAGAVYLRFGPITASFGPEDADLIFEGEGFDDALGTAVAVVPDVTGDGLPDLAMGAPGFDDFANRTGAIYLLAGPPASGAVLDDAVLESGRKDANQIGAAMSPAGDVDGDGINDMIVGIPKDADTGTSGGGVYILHGPVTAAGWASKDHWSAESAGDLAGSAVLGAGDLDGDGTDDLLIGAPNNDEAGTSAGAAYLLSGPIDGNGNLSYANAMLMGSAKDDKAGSALAAGDLDGDGVIDLLIGAPREEVNPGPGTGYLLFGPVTGSIDLGLADMILSTSTDGDRTGSAALLADIDGDGDADLLLSAPGESSAGTDAGLVLVLHGGGRP